jgi:hypothetical protein
VISEADILRLQAHAVATDDMALLYLTYAALGFDRGAWFEPLTEEERSSALQGCADQLEMFRLTGTELKEIP